MEEAKTNICVEETLLCQEGPFNANRSIVVRNEQKGHLMAYQKPSSILVAGSTVWNAWRQDNADVQAFEPDLHAVDLHQANLQGIDFHEADLTEANLQGADLRGADLRAADLRHANLRGADLSDTQLQKAHLHGADLRDAKLCNANLQWADLSNADLRDADLSGADMEKANLDHARFATTHASANDQNEIDHVIVVA